MRGKAKQDSPGLDRFAASYLALSSLSGVIEIGTVILVIRMEKPLYGIPLVGLAYQLGAFFREPIQLASWLYYLAVMLSLMLAVVASQSLVFLLLTVFLLSVGVQGIRGIASRNQRIGTFTKRVFRIAGFASSGLVSWKNLPMVAGLTLLAALLAMKAPHRPLRTKVRNVGSGPIGWTMMVHQSHYFSYAYMIPLTLINNYGIAPRLAGTLFCIGWLSYISSRRVFGKHGLILVFALGHILAAFSLAGLFLCSSGSLGGVLGFWFLTGFGGGTVYALHELKRTAPTEQYELGPWENIGHVLGVLISLVALLVLQTPRPVFLVASMIALATLALFLSWSTAK